MSGKHIQDKSISYCKILYGWLNLFKNWVGIIAIILASGAWFKSQFNDVKIEISTLRATEHYVDTAKIQYTNLYATCYRSDARIDSVEWRIADLAGVDSILTEEVIETKNRVFQLEHKQ